MELGTILKGLKQCFRNVPLSDVRAKIGPYEFIVSLIFCFTQDRGARTIASLREEIIKLTGKSVSRGSFWERLATERLFTLLLELTLNCMEMVAQGSYQTKQISDLLKTLGVSGITVLDSSSMSLRDMAGLYFPGPRNNVAPAVIKWHSCFDLFGGIIKWFDISPGTSHDSNHFPDLKTLVGKLIIFDLGYWDYALLESIDAVGGFFLSRVKSNAAILIIDVVCGLPRSAIGKELFRRRIPKGQKIVEVIAWLGDSIAPVRVIGFWNVLEKRYHWYTTNLLVDAQIIYPLYRLRWQTELLFKKSKSSLRLKDITSTNPNIIQSLLLATIIATTISYPVAFRAALFDKKNKKTTRLPTIQRAGKLLVHLSREWSDFLLTNKKKAEGVLIAKLKLLTNELYDPNLKRESSIQRVFRIAKKCA
jgi:putative transposase